jgi:hypothetical protein
MEILLVNLKVAGDLLDPGGEESNLNLGGTCVGGFPLELLDDLLLPLGV